jgi:hypothetical protein
MIRLWPTRRMGKCDCRVTLEEVATHERKEFPDLDSLFGYLHTQAEAQFSNLEPAALADTL